MRSIMISIFSGLVLASVVSAQEIPASAIPATWVQGEPVTAWTSNTLYVVEGFATWCGPCRAAIPHLEALYQEIKKEPGVALFSVCVMDRKPVEEVRAFLAKQKVVPTYPMALDVANTVQKQWLTSLNVRGVPFVFFVRNGQLVWRGHPSALTMDAIRAVKAGKDFPVAENQNTPIRNPYDAALAAKNYKEAERLLRERIEATADYKRVRDAQALPAWLSKPLPQRFTVDTTPLPAPTPRPTAPDSVNQRAIAYYHDIQTCMASNNVAGLRATVARALEDKELPGNWCAMYTYQLASIAYHEKDYQGVVDQMATVVDRFPTDPLAIGFVQEVLSKVEELQDVGRLLHLRVILLMAEHDKRPGTDYEATCYNIAARLCLDLNRPDDAVRYSVQALESSTNAQRLRALLNGKILTW